MRFACCFAKYVIQDRCLSFIASQFEIVAKDLEYLLFVLPPCGIDEVNIEHVAIILLAEAIIVVYLFVQ